MADDPKKKKPASPTGEAGSLAGPAGPNPAAELSYEEYNKQLQESLKKPAEGQAAPEPEVSPVKSWWDKLNGVMSKQRDPADIARSAARGVVSAGVNAARTAAEFSVGQALPGSDPLQKKVGEAVGGALNKGEDAVLGKKSDDSLASFTESALQFATGFAAANLVLPGSGIAKGLAKGAMADYSAFDPYEAQLAELAASSKVPGLNWLGKVLSVKGDDGPTIARFKRAAAGAIPGVVLDGLVAGASRIKAANLLKGGAAGAEKKAAEATLESSAKVLKDIADGTHVPEGSHVKVTEVDGGFTIEHSEHAPLLDGVAGTDSPIFKDKAEAVQQAASMDHAIQDRLDAGKIEIDHGELHTAFSEGALDEVPLTVSAHNTVEQDIELVKKLSDSIVEQRKALEATTGGSITIEQGKDLAKEMLARIPDESLHGVIHKLLKTNPESQDIVAVMTEMVLGQKGRNIGKLWDIVEARPHDPVALENLVQAVKNHGELARELGVGESAGARRLRFVQERDAFRKEGFASAEEATAAKAAEGSTKAAATKEASDVFDDVLQKIGKNKTDTDAATQAALTGGDAASASDFSLARERARITAALKKLYGDKKFEYDAESAIERTNKIREEADAQRTTPVSLSAEDAAAAGGAKTKTVNPIEELSRWMDSSESALDKNLAKTEGLIKKAKAQLEENPVSALLKNGEPPKVAGMAVRDASQQALDEANAKFMGRLMKLTNGAPANLDAAIKATQIVQKGGKMRVALEWFTNSILSGPQTWATVLTSGQALSLMEPFVKMTAGTLSGNKALIREGVDTMVGVYSHLGDNIKIAAAAMREGRSIINPTPTTYAIGGVTGKIVRAPGNIMMGLDEFTRVSNYRAHVRAKSLRAGREAGLDGAALAQKVDADLRVAFDPETGIATIPESLKYADVATLSAGLNPGFGKELQSFTNNALMAKFVVPFVRASSNIFDYVWQATPGLNHFNKASKAIMEKGGEEAAVLHARRLLATTVGMYAYTQAVQGNLTGKGPSDPELRKLWLADNQPYSVKVGKHWVSYNRLDPLATPLGLMADYHVFRTEQGHENHDAEDILYATLGAIAANLGSKTYLKGIMDFSEAWSKGDPNAVGKYLQRQVSSFAVLNFANKLNPDPYYREVDSMADAIKARMPYFSEALDPRHNIFGEKTLKADGVFNRGVNPFTTKEVTHSKVEEELLSIGKGLAPFSSKLEGTIDLHSKEFVEKKGQPSPYVRLMELVRNPGGGLPSLREAMEDKIKTPGWNELSDGTDDFKGGRKLAILGGVKERYEQQALRQVLSEYPKLAERRQAVIRGSGAAFRGGEEGQAQSELLTGPIRK